jgi:gamma-glutamylputrescine oxidase
MTVSYWQRTASARRAVDCDVCIIGAGVAGACAALWLNRFAPNLKIAIVEARKVGSGASGRNAGMILAGLSEHYDAIIERFGRAAAQEIWRATLEHQRHVRDFLRETNADVALDECGSWRLAFEEAEREHLERSAALLREDGFECEFRRDDPLGRNFYGALGIRTDAGVHPVRFVRAILEASGAEVLTNCEACRIDADDSAVRIVTSEVDIRAARLIVAANAYAPLIDKSFELLVAPHRGQIFVTAPLRERVVDRLVYAHHGYIYFRQLPDRRFLLGGWRHEFASDEAGYVDDVSASVQNALERFMRERFPETRDVPIEARWAGTMGFSPDGLPCVGLMRGDERIAFAVGFTGHGFGLAFEVMRRTVEMLLYGAGVGIFDARRFEKSERQAI